MKLQDRWIETDVAFHPLIGVTVDSDLGHAAKVMLNRNIGALGIYSSDGRDLVGILTERDVTRCVAMGDAPDATPVGSYMNADPITREATITGPEARAVMKANGIRHLIVRDGTRFGMISLREL